MGKKLTLILLLGTVLSAGLFAATGNHDHRQHGDRYRHYHYHHNNYDRKKVAEIEYKLDMLESKYKRDKNRLEDSYMDNRERKIKKDELKYKYNMEKERLKAQKKAVKKGYRN